MNLFTHQSTKSGESKDVGTDQAEEDATRTTDTPENVGTAHGEEEAKEHTTRTTDKPQEVVTPGESQTELHLILVLYIHEKH